MVQTEDFRRLEGEGGKAFMKNLGEVRTSHTVLRAP